MTEINSVSGVNKTVATVGANAVQKTQTAQVDFNQFPGEDSFTANNLHNDVKNFMSNNKGEIKLDTSWYHFIFGEDHIEFTPKNKMTYGELRNTLGIPPKVLSNTNGKRLRDDQVIDGTVKVNLDDIGWYPQTGLYPEERAVNNSLRNEGIYTAGYDRAVKSEDIINWLK